MNLTTNPLRPAITSPTIFSSQNTDFSQDCSCMSKNLTKWRISAHEGSRKPHELGGERSERAKRGNGRKKWENGGCRVDASLTTRWFPGSYQEFVLCCHQRKTDQGWHFQCVAAGIGTLAGSVSSQTSVYPSPLWRDLRWGDRRSTVKKRIWVRA